MGDDRVAFSGVEGAPVAPEHARHPLRRDDLLPDPVALFDRWIKEASDLPLANAVVLSTVGDRGMPSSRVVLLKDHDTTGFTIFTNYESRKGCELDTNPACSLLFWWRPHVRQVRIEGHASRLSPEASDAYFVSRPRGSRIGAWASPQSRPITDRADLMERVDACEDEFADGPIARPDHWGGYCIVPQRLEFWQGGRDRLHDRFVYTRQDDGRWQIERLAP